jgi:large subunit ribosomal protein L22
MAEARAVLKYARVSPRKARTVINEIRHRDISNAIELLQFSNTKAAKIIKKVLESAVANAESNSFADIDLLKVDMACVDEGPVLKRGRPRAMGQFGPIRKPTSHITIKVKEV